MADISKITIGGTTYNIKDTTARTSQVGGLHFVGLTSTNLTDGATNKTLTPTTPASDGKAASLTKTTGFVNGDVVQVSGATGASNSNEYEFVYINDEWNEYGRGSKLGTLAMKSSASSTSYFATSTHKHSVTGGSHSHNMPSQTVSTSATYTPGGSVTINQAANNALTVGTGSTLLTTGEMTPVSIKGVSGTVNLTGVGGSATVATRASATTGVLTSVKTNGATPTLVSKTVKSITDNGTMFTASVDENSETLTLTAGSAPTSESITFNAVSNAGSMPTFNIGSVWGTAGTTKVATAASGATTVATADANPTTFNAVATSTTATYANLNTKLAATFAGTQATITSSGSTTAKNTDTANVGILTVGESNSNSTVTVY